MKIAGGCCKDELCNISAKDALLIVFEIENGKIKTAEEEVNNLQLELDESLEKLNKASSDETIIEEAKKLGMI